MKKLLSAILIFAFALSLTACGTPNENFVSAIERYDDTKAITCTYDNSAEIVIDGKTYTITAKGKTLLNNKKEQFQINGESITKYNDKDITKSFEIIYDDELYFSSGSECYYEEIDFDEARDFLFGYTMLHGVSEESFDNIEETTEDGNLVYTFSLSDTYAGRVTGIASHLSKIMKQVGSDGNISVKDLSGVLKLDNTKRPQAFDMTVSAEIKTSGKVITVSETFHMTYEMEGTNFEISAPDDSANYQKIE